MHAEPVRRSFVDSNKDQTEQLVLFGYILLEWFCVFTLLGA